MPASNALPASQGDVKSIPCTDAGLVTSSHVVSAHAASATATATAIRFPHGIDTESTDILSVDATSTGRHCAGSGSVRPVSGRSATPVTDQQPYIKEV